MGQAASKQARKLPQKATAINAMKAKPQVAPARKQEPSSRPDGEDPQVASFAQRLHELGAAQTQHHQGLYQPVSKDKMTITLNKRMEQEQKNESLFKQEEKKTLLPTQTITAIIRDIQDGDTRESILRTYNIDSSVLDKLKHLTVPKGAVGVRR